ncbi:MAG: glycosyltransferase family 2 protein [SAR324 cluster bacterium]|nr:glycosyltransferase family 2 protein [SAR324 cluster bacterium]
MFDLSIIIPTYNEADNILILINRLRELLTPICRFEILVVDDDSPDMTWKIVEKVGQTDDHVVSIRRRKDRGLSQAVCEGFNYSRGKYLAVIDADLQHDEQLLVKMLKKIPEYKMIIGSRKANGGGIEDWNWFRRFLSLGATQLAHIVIKTKVTDPMSGFFMLKRSTYEALKDKINPKGFKILLEFLYHLNTEDVAELGYVFKPRERGESKLDSKVMIDYLVGLYSLKFGPILPVDFIKYCIVGSSGVAVNMGVLYISTLLGNTNQISLSLAIIVSMFTNYLLNNFWTFKQHTLKGIGILTGFFQYIATCSVGALINYAVSITLIQEFAIAVMPSGLVGIALATIWNYTLGKKWVWKKSSR